MTLTTAGDRLGATANPAVFNGPTASPEAPIDRYGVIGNSVAIPAYTGNVVTIALTPSTSVSAAPVQLQNAPPTTGGNLTPAPIPASLGNVSLVFVQVNGQVFQQVAGTPGPGQFSYNSSNQQLSLGGSGLTGAVLFGVQAVGGHENILTGKYPAQLFSFFVSGDLGYSYDDQTPSLAVTASATDLNASAYLSIFTPGVFTLNANGTPFRLATRTVTERGRSNQVDIALAFQGIHAAYGELRNGLDRPISIKQDLLQGQDECKYSYTIGQVLTKAGVPISGSIPIEIKVPKDIDEKQTITARAVLTGDYPLLAGKIVRFDGNAIEIVDPNSTTFHAISDAEILGDFSFDYNGNGDLVGGIPLVSEWKNAVLELEDDPHGGEGDGDSTYSIVNKTSPDPTQPPTSLDSFGFTLPFNPNNLRTTDWAFDAGGRTDSIETTTYTNGQTVKIVKETYGFVYTSRNIYDLTAYITGQESPKIFSNPVPATLWKLVRSEVTDVLFDSDGYEIGRQTTGWELSRARQEQDDEVLALIKERESATGDRFDQLTKLLRLYGVNASASYPTFLQQTPLNPTTTYSLEALSKYYKDVPKPDEGQPAALFARATETFEDTIKTVPNPESTVQAPLPPIVFGRYQLDRQDVEIVSARAPEIFEERAQQQTKEAENLTQTAVATQFQQNAGRPGVQPRLQTQGTGCTHPKPPFDSNAPDLKYLISTVSHPDFTAETTTIRFTGAYDFETALSAAKLKAKIDNMQALTVQIQIDSDRPIRTWDSIFWRGKEWKVTSIDRTELSQYQLHTLARYQLTLGIWQDVPIVTKVLQDGVET
jgi:hypothetical protein